jgi:hypothetical protein
MVRVRDGSGEAIRTPEARLNGRTATLLLFAKWPCDTATARPASAGNAQTVLRRSIPFASKNPVNRQQEFRRRNAA